MTESIQYDSLNGIVMPKLNTCNMKQNISEQISSEGRNQTEVSDILNNDPYKEIYKVQSDFIKLYETEGKKRFLNANQNLLQEIKVKIGKFFNCSPRLVSFDKFINDYKCKFSFLYCHYIGFKVRDEKMGFGKQYFSECNYRTQKMLYFQGNFYKDEVNQRDAVLFFNECDVFRNQAILFKGSIVYGLRQGYSQFFGMNTETGQNFVRFEGVYQNNREDGERIQIYNEEGCKTFEGSVINGKKQGVCRIYNELGIILEECNYKNDQKNGTCITYQNRSFNFSGNSPNILEQSNWEDNKRKGFYKISKVYKSNLENIENQEPINAMLCNIFSDINEDMSDSEEFVRLAEIGTIDSTKMTNNFTSYHKNGKLKARYTLDNDSKTLKVSEFHSNGQPLFNGNAVIVPIHLMQKYNNFMKKLKCFGHGKVFKKDGKLFYEKNFGTLEPESPELVNSKSPINLDLEIAIHLMNQQF